MLLYFNNSNILSLSAFQLIKYHIIQLDEQSDRGGNIKITNESDVSGGSLKLMI